MIQLKDLRYARLGTRDPAAAAEYAQKILGLELVRREGGAIYLRGDDRDHTLVYFKGDPADHTVGWEVADPAALDAAGAELEARRIAVRRGRRAECEARYVEDFLSFDDPSGNTHDLVVRPHHSGRRFFPARDCGVWSFSHIGLRTTDAARDEAFWTGVLSARVSDRIGPAPLLRIDEVHHKVALFPVGARRRAAREPPGAGRRRRDALVLLPARAGRADRVRAGPASDLGRGVPLLRRARRHGLRVLDRRAADQAGGGGELPPAPVPVHAVVVLHVGLEPDIAEFRTREDAAPSKAA